MMTRNQVSAFLALSLVFWVALLLWRDVPITLEMLLPFGSVVGAVSLSLLVFDQWAWHWPIFRGWLVKRPRIHGTWAVELKSDWIDPSTSHGIAPIHCYMVVRQTASSLSFRLITSESRSETVSAGIEVCRDSTFEISCAYRNKPRSEFRHRSEVHYGAMLLVADTASPARLEGEYWTDRKTTGTITLGPRKAGVCMTFEEAEALFEP
jgi:hypothetical protein